MKINFKTTANKITLIRIIIIPILWILAIINQKKIFVLFFLIAGFTDFLDGFIARSLNQVTKFGAFLDSFADNTILACTPIWFWILLPNFFLKNIIIILILFFLFSFSLLIGYIKFRKMISYHLYLNKFANIFFYIFINHALLFQPNKILFAITSIAGGLGCIEEILITLTHKKMKENILSIFKKSS